MRTKKLILSKIIKISLLTVLSHNSLPYCMCNEINTQNSINEQNNLLGRKRNMDHEQEDVDIPHKSNTKVEKFCHSVSFDPSELTSEIEFYNNEFEFHFKYDSKLIDDEDVDKFINCASFKYDDFVNANNRLKEIIKFEENKNIQNNQIDKYYTILNNLSNKNFPILDLTQDDFEIIKENYYKVHKNSFDLLNTQYCDTESEKLFEISNIENIIKQIGLLKNNINIMKDRLYYKSLIDRIKRKEYGVYKENDDDDMFEEDLFISKKELEEIRERKRIYEMNKELYAKKLSLLSDVENVIKHNKDFSKDLFDQLNEVKLINRDINISITNEDFKIYKNLYNLLKSSDDKLEKFNIIEQVYSMVTNSKKLFSIFNDILLRSDEVFKMFNDLLRECLNVQLQNTNIFYGGTSLMHQTILNTINKYFINNSNSEIKYCHSKQYNEEKINDSYNIFFNKIFYNVSSYITKRNMTNYLNRIVINKLNEAISDVERYRNTFLRSDYEHGYEFFNNLYKFLNNNMDGITKYFVNDLKDCWEKEIDSFKNYMSDPSLFKKMWLSTPKFPQLVQIWNRINEYNNNILKSNNNSENEIENYKNNRDRVIRNFWRNFILDKDILDLLLQQNDIKLLKSINKILNIKEVAEYNAQGIYLYYINVLKENFNKKKINKKQVMDYYFKYLDSHQTVLSNNIKYLESKINNGYITNNAEIFKNMLDLLKLNLSKFEESSIKYKSDDFVKNNIFPKKKKLIFKVVKYK